ncbi:hypothetical protein EVAR_51034_1 [Eumeta japonica]|uniref:Uncharacterized protein n=1 Tax=Eumeta variegata TaxID=151549 RepID=A0A4C1Y8K2_EUMVA|nr:hypothetical protein EVAR_51034_1 [Eumeta japonica]
MPKYATNSLSRTYDPAPNDTILENAGVLVMASPTTSSDLGGHIFIIYALESQKERDPEQSKKVALAASFSRQERSKLSASAAGKLSLNRMTIRGIGVSDVRENKQPPPEISLRAVPLSRLVPSRSSGFESKQNQNGLLLAIHFGGCRIKRGATGKMVERE